MACRLLVAEVTRTARRGGLVRINVRAKDLRRPPRRDAVLTAVDAALALGAATDTYRMHVHPSRAASGVSETAERARTARRSTR